MPVSSSVIPERAPRLPSLLAAPLALLPMSLHSAIVAAAMNRVFTRARQEGELDFLEGKVLRVEVHDARTGFRLTFKGGRLHPAKGDQPTDLTVGGTVYDLLLLAAGQEDPDTLFFQRRLTLDGNTELGLYVKNFLNGQDPQEVLPAPLRSALPRLVPLYERLFG